MAGLYQYSITLYKTYFCLVSRALKNSIFCLKENTILAQLLNWQLNAKSFVDILHFLHF